MSGFLYVELNSACINQDVLRKFDCNHTDFNDFLAEDAIGVAGNGEGITFMAVRCQQGDN